MVVQNCLVNISFSFYFQEKDSSQLVDNSKKDNGYTSDTITCPFRPSQLVAAGRANKQVNSEI